MGSQRSACPPAPGAGPLARFIDRGDRSSSTSSRCCSRRDRPSGSSVRTPAANRGRPCRPVIRSLRWPRSGRPACTSVSKSAPDRCPSGNSANRSRRCRRTDCRRCNSANTPEACRRPRCRPSSRSPSQPRSGCPGCTWASRWALGRSHPGKSAKRTDWRWCRPCRLRKTESTGADSTNPVCRNRNRMRHWTTPCCRRHR
jgi:hypothetical protein